MVFGDYMDDVGVVCGDVCCCDACGVKGDLLMGRKHVGMCYVEVAEWR